MISLTCPKCSTRLEIDDGFHGGVCRCYDCGALMTVPEDPKKEKAEELIRKRLTRRKAPARPAAPRPEAPGGRPPRPEEPASAAAPASGRPSDPNARPKAPVAEEPAEEPSDTLHFETASGREVDIPVDQIDAVPVARKKQAVRWSTRSGVILVMAGMMCIVFWGMLSLFMPGGTTDTGYDPNAGRTPQETDNIFLRDGARFLGQPLDERTVILVDASHEMNERLGWVRRAAVEFLERLPDGHRVQFVWSTPKGPVTYPDEPQPAAAFDRKRWTDQLEAIWASGDVSLKAGFEQALLARPDRVILVAATVPTSQQKYLSRRMRDTPDVKFSLVLLDAANVDPDAPLAQAALDGGGTYVNHPIGKLQRWFNAFDAQHPAPPVDVPAAATGGILREVWLNVSGDQLTRLTQHEDFPNKPAEREVIGSFQTPRNWNDHYGQRLRGYVFPPVTGAYVFELTSDDQAVVYLSTDHSPTAKKRIAGRGGAAGWDDWAEDAQSEPIHLEAGKAYYIEALQKEGGGEDHLRVGWKRPDGRLERPIPGTHLAPPPQPAPGDATAPSE